MIVDVQIYNYQQFLNQLTQQQMNNSKNSQTYAIPFIAYQQGVGFQLSKQAEEFLMSLPQQRQIGIVSIVGKYRTGKSFFVNRVLLDQKKGGFQVGPSINPCTKGLWLWKKVTPSHSNSKMDILMIDTEGFGGMDENANHDSRIFLFSLLLSSYFIYNSQGSIDQNALNTINLIINLAKDINSKSMGKNSQNMSNFPSFLWVVRDFTLQLLDKSGNKINAKEYLQNALQQKGTSDTAENKNKIRRLFKTFFQDRDCELMIRPIEHEKDLQRLDQIDNSNLRPQFVNQVESIRSKILKKTKTKTLNQKPLNGALLVSLCKGYMQIINSGNIPTVQSAWFYVSKSEGIRALREATTLLEHEIIQLEKLPLKYNELSLNEIKSALKEKVVAKFKKRACGSQESHPDLLEKLEKKVQQNLNNIVQKRMKSQYQDAKNELQTLRQELQQQKALQNMQKKYKEQQIERIKKHAQNELNNAQSQLSSIRLTIQKQKALFDMQKRFKQQQMKKIRQDAERELKAIRQALQLQRNQKNMQKRHKQQEIQRYKRQSQNEVMNLNSTLDKERALHSMQKKYKQEELQRYKQRISSLQNQCRRLRSNNTQLTSDFQDLENKYEEKKQQFQVLEQTNISYTKKIQSLLSENSKKNDLMNDQSQWMLEKSYLENQVSFLKTTLNENKRLHDALLVALQQSLSASDSQNNNELIQANKNLSSALQKTQARCKVLEEKYDRIKEFRKLMKNCQSMQCMNCNKWIQTHIFANHIEQCFNSSSSLTLQEKTMDINKQNLHITVSQTIITSSQDKKKPHTQYIIQVNLGQQKWKINKRYRQFSELHQQLIKKYPAIRYPSSSNFLADINNLLSSKQKNIMAEQRRKSLQVYLKDLSKIEEIRSSDIFKRFLELPDSPTLMETKYNRIKEGSEKKERYLL